MVRESLQRASFLFRVLTQRKLDGLDLLEADHVRMDLLFIRWRLAVSLPARDEIFNLIRQEFLNHSHLEESVFYPTCEKLIELKRLVSTAMDDHKFIKGLLKEISELPLHNDRIASKMRILISEIRQHAMEEENVLFPRVRLVMRKSQFDKLSREIRLAKETRPAAHKKPGRHSGMAA